MAFIIAVSCNIFDTTKLSEFKPLRGQYLYQASDENGEERFFRAVDVKALLVRGSVNGRATKRAKRTTE